MKNFKKVKKKIKINPILTLTKVKNKVSLMKKIFKKNYSNNNRQIIKKSMKIK
jgi:hypothetical protein